MIGLVRSADIALVRSLADDLVLSGMHQCLWEGANRRASWSMHGQVLNTAVHYIR